MRMMEPLLTSPTDSEIQSMIHFLCGKGAESLDIHREISSIYTLHT